MWRNTANVDPAQARDLQWPQTVALCGFISTCWHPVPASYPRTINPQWAMAMTAAQLDAIRRLALQLLIAHAAQHKERNT
jgi:hypothetical protein